MSASGYMASSGTQAPWSRPRVGRSRTGSFAGIRALTVAASSGAPGARYFIS